MKNCLTYAVGMWFRHGGYIMIRKSLIARLHGVGKWHPLQLVPHFLHRTKDGKITQLVRTPEESARAKEKGPWRDWAWLWHFEGHIIEGDVDYETLIVQEF